MYILINNQAFPNPSAPGGESGGFRPRQNWWFDVEIRHAHDGAGVAAGYTIHAITGLAGKPKRPPAWLLETLTQDDPPGQQ